MGDDHGINYGGWFSLFRCFAFSPINTCNARRKDENRHEGIKSSHHYGKMAHMNSKIFGAAHATMVLIPITQTHTFKSVLT